MTTLVMFSGGLDSTAMLYRLLTQTDQDLRVHHLRMVNREDRAQAEQDATEAVIAWCKANCRPFRYSESGVDFADLDTVPIDYLTVAYVACQVVIDTPGCNCIAVGTLHADLDEVKRKVSVAQRTVFDAMYACYRARKVGEPVVEWIYPVYEMTKAEVAASLPAALRDASWSCRRPVRTASGYRICGECKPCRFRAEVSARLGVPL